MRLPVWVVFLVIGLGSGYVWLVREKAIGALTIVSGLVWSGLAIRGGTVTQIDQAGSSATWSSPVFQTLAAFFALVSFVAWVLWYFGEFPVVEDELEAGM